MSTVHSHPFTIQPQADSPDPLNDCLVRTRSSYENALTAQAEAESHFADMAMLDDSGHCRECGDFTSGSRIGGSHVQLCDGCITAWVLAHIGTSMVLEAVRDLSA